jgi:hypothetical protein
MNEPQLAFHMEEYKQIRGEVTTLLARLEMLLRFALIVSASVYAWLVVQSFGLLDPSHPCLRLPPEILNYGWLIPPVFIVLGGLMALASLLRIRQMGTYLRKIEEAVGHPALGWEAYLETKRPTIAAIALLAWISLFAAAAFATRQGFKLTDEAARNHVCTSETKTVSTPHSTATSSVISRHAELVGADPGALLAKGS